MKILKKINFYNNYKIKSWLNKNCINLIGYKIHYNEKNEILVDVDGSIFLNQKMHELPFKINKLNGNFLCTLGGLTSFNNFPNEINGYLSCSHCTFNSFENFPTKILGDIIFSNNICEYNGKYSFYYFTNLIKINDNKKLYKNINKQILINNKNESIKIKL